MTELSPEAREIIQKGGSADGPSNRDRDRVRKALMATIAGGATAASASSASAATTTATATTTSLSATAAATAAAANAVGISLTTKLLVAAAIALGAGTGIYLASDGAPDSAPEGPATGVVPEPAPIHKQTPAPTEPTAPTEPEPTAVIEAPTSDRESKRDPQPARAAVEPEPIEPAQLALAREQQLLRDANRAMRTGDAAGALSLLDDHAASFPAGQLAPERAATRVHALCALGRDSDAKQLAADFRERHPRSPLLARIDRSCAK